MRQRDLNAFLASVRRTRFVDYLDPLGETAQAALERRLAWARVSQHDPAYAEEARFLLDNADALREVLRKELDEDDWIEDTTAGREWGPPPRVTTLAKPKTTENDRVTEIFNTDDLRSGNSHEGLPPRRRPSNPPVDRRIVHDEDTDPRLAEEETEYLSDFEDPDHMPTGIMRLEDLTDPPSAPRKERPQVPDVPAAVVAGMAASTSSSVRENVEFSEEGDSPVLREGLRTAPSALTRHRRPTPLTLGRRSEDAPVTVDKATPSSAGVSSALEIRASERPRAPSRAPRVAGGVLAVLLLVGVLGVGLVVAAPALLATGTAPAPEPEPFEIIGPVDPEPEPVVAVVAEPEPEPEPVPVEPEPEPVPEPLPAPEPVAAVPAPPRPAPEPVPEPKPVPEPVPEPEPVAVAPEPAPQPAPAPAPQPAPEPEPEPVAVAVAAEPAPAPAPAPEPAAEATPSVDVKGLWMGAGDGRSMKITIATQQGPSFSGTAQLQLEDGSWTTLDISGVVTGSNISFSGGEAYFDGSVSGPRATGTFTLTSGAAPKSWSVIR